MREKAAWIFLITTVAAYVPYFVYISRLLGRGEFQTGVVFGAFIFVIIIQSLLATFAGIIFTFRQRKEPKDERDAAVEARSLRWAYYVLAASCFSAVLSVPSILVSPLGAYGSRSFVPLLISQVLLLCFIAAEATRYLALALGYRRGV